MTMLTQHLTTVVIQAVLLKISGHVILYLILQLVPLFVVTEYFEEMNYCQLNVMMETLFQMMVVHQLVLLS